MGACQIAQQAVIEEAKHVMLGEPKALQTAFFKAAEQAAHAAHPKAPTRRHAWGTVHLCLASVRSLAQVLDLGRQVREFNAPDIQMIAFAISEDPIVRVQFQKFVIPLAPAPDTVGPLHHVHVVLQPLGTLAILRLGLGNLVQHLLHNGVGLRKKVVADGTNLIL